MKSEFQAKFLQHLIQKKEDKGFTLIELLVVIIIIGILSAIALPSFLNQANKAKQSEAKQYVGSMNRGQQAYYLEKAAFTDKIGLLGLGIKTQTDNYAYVSTTASNGATNQGRSLKDTLKSYVGGVQTANITATSEATTLAVLCEKDVAKNEGVGGDISAGVTINGTDPVCAGGYSSLAGK